MRSFVLFVLCACVSVTLAVQVVYTGAFVETRTDSPNAKTGGYFYYRYDSANEANCRFRVEYYLPGGRVNNLYQYKYDTYAGKSVLYSMCDQCSAETISEMPDPWWYDSSLYNRAQQGNLYKCTRKSTSASSMVSSIVSNGATSPESLVVDTINFYDG